MHVEVLLSFIFFLWKSEMCCYWTEEQFETISVSGNWTVAKVQKLKLWEVQMFHLAAKTNQIFTFEMWQTPEIILVAPDHPEPLHLFFIVCSSGIHKLNRGTI